METAILILQSSLIQQKEQLSLAEKKYNLCVVKKQADFRKRGIDNIKGFIAEIEDAILVLERAVGEPSETDSNCNIQHVSKSVCDHDYAYKILHDHTAADVCTKCGNIKKQTGC